MLSRNGKILLGQRHADPVKASSEMHGEGTWTMPGGKLNFGETLKAAAVREILEETGIKITEADLKLISLSDDILPDVHFVTAGFLCDSFIGEARVTEPDEITQWQWFSLDNLPAPVYPPSKKVLNSFITGRIY